MVDPAAERQHVVAEVGEDLLERRIPSRGAAAGTRAAISAGRRLDQHGLVAPTPFALDQPVDDLVADPAHRLRIDGQRIPASGSTPGGSVPTAEVSASMRLLPGRGRWVSP